VTKKKRQGRCETDYSWYQASL